MMKLPAFVKRIVPIAIVLLLALTSLTFFVMLPAAAADTVAATGAYETTDFSDIAANDFNISAASDTDNSSATVADNGELVINAVNAVEQKYYGALLPIDPDRIYTSFTFELTFKVNKTNGDMNRWIGIVYRTRSASVSAPITGYIMNYRLNGKNAYSAVNPNKSFHDINVIESGGMLADGTIAPVLMDGDYHTITIMLDGDVAAKHYIDGHLIREAKLANQTSHLGGVYSSGGFALIVNSMELSVKSCKITPNRMIAPQPIPSDNAIVTTYRDQAVKIANAPAVVCDVTDKAALGLLESEKKPSNAILRFDKDENIVGANGETLGSFSEIYAKLDHKIIPVVRVDDDDAATAFITYLTQKNKILDIAVMSDKPELVKSVRTAYPKIRGIIEYSDADFYTDGELKLFDNIVGKTNANYAMTAIIPQSEATTDNVRYIQARFKTVWVRPDSSSAADLYTSVNSGAFGIVTTDFDAVYTVLESYPQNSLTRMPYNIAHRGMFENTAVGPYENSLKAVENAISGGATHLELDGHLTKDGHIIIMHDTSIDRTTTGSGEISTMTLEQIKQYRLLDGQEIPTLEQVLDLLCKAKQSGKDIVFVFELKAGATIAQKIDSLLGTGEGQYDIRDNIVIITFNNSGDDLLTSIKNVMPTTPTSHLTSATKATLAGDLADMGMYNCGYDMIYIGVTPEYDKECLTDRGISSWYWTFDNADQITDAVKKGHLGLTNNAPRAIAHYFYKIELKDTAARDSVSVGDKTEVMAYRYNGLKSTQQAEIFQAIPTENGWNVIASISMYGITLYTQAYYIENSAPPVIVPEKQTVTVIANGANIVATIGENGNVEFTPPAVDGMKFIGLFTDASFTTPATAQNITDGMTVYAKYDPVAKPTEEKPNDKNPNAKPNLGLAVGLPLGIVGAAAIGVALFFILRKKRKQ